MSSTHPIVAERIISPAAWALVEDKVSPFAKDLIAKAVRFVQDECLPAEPIYLSQIGQGDRRWTTVPPIVEQLKQRARSLGLWNLFLSAKHYPDVGSPLTNLEYAIIAEVTGRGHHFVAESFNCSAPDTGNMEVLAKYGNEEQKRTWLQPLLNGEIRSAFAMTERFVASSDATNIRTQIRREGDEIVVNGHKWWISGAGDPRCKVHLLMGKSDPDNANPHRQQSMVIIPADAPGVRVVRPMQVFGYDDAPEGHCEVVYDNVRVPLKNLIKGWGAGFEIIQGRLGPGRIHHCMRSLGVAERSLELMLRRATDDRKKAFGKMLQEHGTIVANIARARMAIDSARLLVLSAAHMIDLVGAKGAQREIGMSKVVVVNACLEVVDMAMQAHGAEGISQDTILASAWVNLRTLRYADGPDEVHLQQQGKIELRRAKELWQREELLQRRVEELLKKHGGVQLESRRYALPGAAGARLGGGSKL